MPENNYNLSVSITASADEARNSIAAVADAIAHLPESVDIPVRIVQQAGGIPEPTLPKAARIPSPTLPRASQIPAPIVPRASQIPAPIVPRASQIPAPIVPRAAQIPAPIVPRAAQIPAPTLPPAPKVAAVEQRVSVNAETEQAVKAIDAVADAQARLPKAVDIPVRIVQQAGMPPIPAVSVPSPTLPKAQAPAVNIRQTAPTFPKMQAKAVPAAEPVADMPKAGVFGGVLAAAKGAVAAVSGVFKGAGTAVSKAFSSVSGAVAKAFGGIVGTVSKIIGGISGAVSKAFGVIGTIGGIAAKAVILPFKAIGGIVSGVFGGILKGARGLFGAVTGVFGGIGKAIVYPFQQISPILANLAHLKLALDLVRGAVSGLVQAIQPAAEFEQYQNQLEVLLKSQTKAAARFADLKKYAKDTNFNPDEVVAAGSAMQAFGLWTNDGMKRLRLAGDAANAFGMSIQDVVRSLNYLNTGRGGEAMESLSRMGITRDKLKPFGVQFAKSGELMTKPKKAVKAVFKYIDANYQGMTARMGKTWKGAVAQMGGEIKDALAGAFKNTLPYMTNIVNGVTSGIGKLGKMLKNIRLDKYLAGPLTAIRGLVDLLGDAADQKSMKPFAKLWDGLGNTFSDAWDGLKSVGGALLDALSGILSASWKMLEDTVGKLKDAGTWESILTAMGNILFAAFKGGSELFKGVLDIFAPRLVSDMKVLWDTIAGAIPGLGGAVTGEKAKRDNIAKGLKDVQFNKFLATDEGRAFRDEVAKYAAEHKKTEMEWVPVMTPGMVTPTEEPVTRERDWTAREINEEAERRYWESAKGREWLAKDYQGLYDKAMGFDGASSVKRAEKRFKKAKKHFSILSDEFSSIVSDISGAMDTSGIRQSWKDGKAKIEKAATGAKKKLAGDAADTLAPLVSRGSASTRRDLADARKALADFDKANGDRMDRLMHTAFVFSGTGRVKRAGGRDARKAYAKLQSLWDKRQEKVSAVTSARKTLASSGGMVKALRRYAKADDGTKAQEATGKSLLPLVTGITPLGFYLEKQDAGVADYLLAKYGTARPEKPDAGVPDYLLAKYGTARQEKPMSAPVRQTAQEATGKSLLPLMTGITPAGFYLKNPDAGVADYLLAKYGTARPEKPDAGVPDYLLAKYGTARLKQAPAQPASASAVQHPAVVSAPAKTRAEIDRQAVARPETGRQPTERNAEKNPLLDPVRTTAETSLKTSSFVSDIRKTVSSLETKMASLVDLLSRDITLA